MASDSETKGKKSWDSYWLEEANRSYWLEPEPTVVSLVKGLDKSVIRDALDLGCGIGRHTLCLAEAGFNVTAVDDSAMALMIVRARVKNEARVKIICADYSQDLFLEESFDLVLSWNVLYHGNRESFKSAVQLVHKWLRPNGLFYFSCPTRRDSKYGNGEKVAPHTYRPMNSVHPGDVHYFADEVDVSECCQSAKWDTFGTEHFGIVRRCERAPSRPDCSLCDG